MCSSVLQCVAVQKWSFVVISTGSDVWAMSTYSSVAVCFAVCCSELWCVAVCCSVLQGVTCEQLDAHNTAMDCCILPSTWRLISQETHPSGGVFFLECINLRSWEEEDLFEKSTIEIVRIEAHSLIRRPRGIGLNFWDVFVAKLVPMVPVFHLDFELLSSATFTLRILICWD